MLANTITVVTFGLIVALLVPRVCRAADESAMRPRSRLRKANEGS